MTILMIMLQDCRKDLLATFNQVAECMGEELLGACKADAPANTSSAKRPTKPKPP